MIINKLSNIELKKNYKFSLNLNKSYKEFNNKKESIRKYNEEKITEFDTDYFLNSYNYTPKLQKSIKNLKKLIKIKYEFNNTEVFLDIYYNKLSKNKISEILNLINFNIILFKNIHNKVRKQVNINILLTNNKKTININKNNQLTKGNINSGYTQNTFDNTNNFIVVYRSEELLKVITHEMIHLYNLHLHKSLNIKINKLIKNNNRFFSIYESYTEAFAIIFYTFYYSKVNNEDYNDLMKNQIKFNYVQVAKLLYSQNILNINELKLINEETNAISYYLLKNLILTNFNKFKLIFNKNNGYLLENEERVIKFDKILINSFKTDKNNLNNFLDLLSNNKIDKDLMKTFRMNILD